MTTLEIAPPKESGEFRRRFLGNRNAVIGGTLVAIAVLTALFATALAPHSYTDTNMLLVWGDPDAEHWLGLDALGRDILSRILVGARVSLGVAAAVLTLTLAFGTAVGMVAAYLGGWIDTVAMRAADIILAFPELIFAILLAAVLGPGVVTVVLALAITWWPGIARLARSLVLSLRHEAFVEAAVASGTRPTAIMLRHFLPNIVAPLIVRASIGVGFIITAEATLSFLGLGVQEPTPSWGGMIRDGLTVLRTDPSLAISASTVLGVTILGFNLLGDGLRDLLDPRARDR
ncbi:MAG TPA: ABC transporter permease [Stellaceae bacterium]|nr:ABC transporter permease [Stellaceae bacterium]